MTSGIEGFGELAEGAAIARAVEPGHGRTPAAGDGHFHESNCLNCDTPLTGNYCVQCGQMAHLHRTMGAFLHDLLHGVLHLEGKTWRTLPMLAIRPGKLTREYVDGKRASYVSPMALFLFSVFLMFAVFQIAGISAPTTIETSGEQVAKGVTQTREQTAAELTAAKARLGTLAPDDADYGKTEARIADLQETLGAIEATEEYILSDQAWANIGPTGIPLIDKGAQKWRENPGLMIYKLQANSYKFSWLLIPLSLPFIWLLFAWKRAFTAYDHAVFVTYSLAFMTLLFVTVTLLALAGVSETILVFLASVVPLVHIYKHLRIAYGLSRFSAVWRLIILVVFIAIILLIFLQILFLLGIF